jgi:Asp-tRNA(Asn)/Glu-tRNA(Gln) amidotransferase A subunit family amidase
MNSETRRIDHLVDLASDLRTGVLSSSDYVAMLEDRFARHEGEVEAFVSDPARLDRFHDRLTELQEIYPSASNRPPLFGVPIGVKDIFHVDGFATQAGSKLPTDELEGHQSTAVSQLEAAGAIVLGKTVTTEFAYFSPGPTRNPLDLERTPGGSSSGSAAAVAAGLCPLALGTETSGSIGRPASYCGVVGFKPSFGRISAEGVIPLAPSLDHIGFFTQDTAGATLVAGLLCDRWRGTEPPPLKPILGIPDESYLSEAQGETLKGFSATVDRLAAAGYEVRDTPALNNFADVDARHRLLVATEAARVHADWYARYSEFYAPKTVELIERGLPIPDQQLVELQTGPPELRTELEDSMSEHGIDLWISPGAPGPAPLGLDSTGDPVMNLPWTHSGVPTVVLPAWTIDEMPIGLQIAGRTGDDEDLLFWANEIEETLGS